MQITVVTVVVSDNSISVNVLLISNRLHIYKS